MNVLDRLGEPANPTLRDLRDRGITVRSLLALDTMTPVGEAMLTCPS